MKLLVGTAILCMLATAPVYAQQNNDNKQQEPSKTPEKRAEKPASKSPEKPVDRPSKPPKEAPVTAKSAPRHQEEQQQQKQAQQEQKQNEQQQKKAGQQAKAEQKARQNEEKTQQKQAKNQQHDQNVNHGHAETADNAPRGGGGGHRIPEDRYRADFGRAHTFHVRHDNDRRFQFGGYWFEYTDAWPSGWGYDDNFYIVEIDGVDYLCDARFPDQRIVVIVGS